LVTRAQSNPIEDPDPVPHGTFPVGASPPWIDWISEAALIPFGDQNFYYTDVDSDIYDAPAKMLWS